MENDLVQFDGQNYLNLETFRKTGNGVLTPVWFVKEGNKFYIITEAGSGKVKRIRNGARVRIVPCKPNGFVTGNWIEARAEIVQNPAEADRLNQLFDQKYGIQKALFSLYNKITQKKRAFIQIETGQA